MATDVRMTKNAVRPPEMGGARVGLDCSRWGMVR